MPPSYQVNVSCGATQDSVGATTPPQGEDKPSSLRWTNLARRFVGIVGAMVCPRPALDAFPSRLFHSHCHSPTQSFMVTRQRRQADHGGRTYRPTLPQPTTLPPTGCWQ